MYQEQWARFVLDGYLSDKIKIAHGVRSSCPLSPLLFDISLEPLAIAVCINRQFVGVKVKGIEAKITLYADDIVCFLQEPLTSVEVMLEFGGILGYKINENKYVCLDTRCPYNYKMRF